MANFTKSDNAGNLSPDQLTELAKSDTFWVVSHLADHTRYDAERVRVLFELGIEKVKELLAKDVGNQTIRSGDAK